MGYQTRYSQGYGRRNSIGPAGLVSSIKSSARRIASNISPTQHSTSITTITNDTLSESIESQDTPSSSTNRSSTSSKASQPRTYTSTVASTSSTSLQQTPDRKLLQSRLNNQDSPKSTSLPAQRRPSTQQTDGTVPRNPPYADLDENTASLPMAATTYAIGFRPEFGKPPSTSQSSVSFGQGGNNATVPIPSLPPAASSTGGMQNPSIVYQQIHDVSSKRISTLDYLKKAHEGRVYWFNTLLFTKADLTKMPFFEPKRLARRATNYLLLGLSLPNIIDLNPANPQEYLRALNALLSEFETYQQMHPPEGGSTSSLSRARIPSMFKRATNVSTKGRRTSSATDIGLPMGTSDPADLKILSNTATAGSTSASFPASEQDLLPGEEYIHLLTPSLPFDPDFFETFATLCDVLIDCYTKVMGLIMSPAMCAPGTGDMFAKADGKLRKVIVMGIVKEFEDASRSGAKTEFAGLGKVVLGGLM